MGRAKQMKRDRAQAIQALQGIRMELAAAAVRKVCRSVSRSTGADCLEYAIVGESVLRSLGVEAQAVAGHAMWRVGPGDGDTLGHHPSAGGMDGRSVVYPQGRSAMFHAWIEAHGRIVDFTTWSLAAKAAAIDAADGGRTAVAWCPEFVVAERRDLASLIAVANGNSAGAMWYGRVASMERWIITEEARAACETMCAAARQAYEIMRAGGRVRVVPVDEQMAA